MLQEKHFTKEICLHQKGMIPYVAYYVVKGGLKLLKRKGEPIVVASGEIIGLEEVWKNKPFNYKILTTPGTVLFYFDKSLLSNFEEALKMIHSLS